MDDAKYDRKSMLFKNGVLGSTTQGTKTRPRYFVAVKPLGKNVHFRLSVFLFRMGVWPNLAPGQHQTGQAQNLAQNATKISPVDQL